MRGVVLFRAPRAPRTVGPRHRGNRPMDPVLALARAFRPTAGPPTGFAGKPTTIRTITTVNNDRSVASVELCSTGEVCRSGLLALPNAFQPSIHTGLGRLAGLKISGCSTGEV